MIVSDSKLDIPQKLVYARQLAEKPFEEFISEIKNDDLLMIICKFHELHLWIPVLNRIDEILESIIKKNNLGDDALKLHVMTKQDEEVVTGVLIFTESLLNRCFGRTIYNSCDRIYDLLNSPSVVIKYHAIRVLTVLVGKSMRKHRYSFVVPEEARNKISYLAYCFPPSLNNDAKLKDNASSQLVNILKGEKNSISSKWKKFDFKFFQSSQPSNAQKPNSSKNFKTKIAKKDSTPEELDDMSSEPSKSSKLGKKKLQKQMGAVDRVSNFDLSTENLRLFTVQQIYDMASTSISEDYFFEFCVQLSIAKSFTSQSFECLQARQKWVQLKLVASACNLLINDSFSRTDDSQMAETDSLNVANAIEIVKPENQEKVDSSVFHDAMFFLASISLKRDLRNELLRLLDGNVSHGTLFKILNAIYKDISSSDDSITIKELSLTDSKSNDTTKAYIAFFQIIKSLIEIKSLSASLVNAGIIDELKQFLTLKSTKYTDVISAAILALKPILIQKAVNANYLNSFANNDGFQLLIDAIGYQVDKSAESKTQFDDLSSITHETKNFDIELLEQNYLSTKYFFDTNTFKYTETLIKFANDLVKMDSGDRMRNFFDSPLLVHFNKVFNNTESFTPLILTYSLSTIISILHNEPTAFSILLEAGIIDAVLNNIQKFAIDDNSLILSLPEVLGAFCLNKSGLERILKEKVVSKLFIMLYDIKIARNLINEDLTTALATGFDELARHYPELKPQILEELFKLIVNAPKVVYPKMKGVCFYKSKYGKSLYYDENEPNSFQEPDSRKIVDDLEDDFYILENAAMFTFTLVSESELGNKFVEEVKKEKLKFEDLLPFLVYGKSTYDHIHSNFSFGITQTAKAVENSKHGWGADVFFEYLYKLVKGGDILEFLNYKNTESMTFFSKFDDGDFNDNSGSDFMRRLNELTIGLNVFQELYLHIELSGHTRANIIGDLFTSPKGLEFIDLVSLLFRRLATEEIIIREHLPPDVAQMSLPASRMLYKPQLVLKSSVYHRPTSLKIEKTSAKIKNTSQIRCIMEDLQSSIGAFMKSMAKIHQTNHRSIEDAAMSKRWKSGSHISQRLSENFIKNLFDIDSLSGILKPLQLKNYILVICHLFEHMIVKKNSSSNLDHFPFGIYFMQCGGFIILRELILRFWKDINTFDPAEVSEFREKLSVKNVKQNNYCITVAFIQKGLSIFSKICSRLAPEKSSKFTSEDSLHYSDSFLTQAKICTFGLLFGVFNSEVIDNEVYLHYIPGAILSDLRGLSGKLYNSENPKKSLNYDGILYELNQDTVCLKESSKNYLKSLGFSETQQSSFFSETLDKSLDSAILFGVCPSYFKEEEWLTVIEKAKNKEVEPPKRKAVISQFQNYRTVEDLNTLRSEGENLIFDNWLFIAQVCPDTVEEVCQLLNSVSKSSYVSESNFFAFDTVMQVISSFDLDFTKAESSSRFSNALKMASVLLNSYHQRRIKVEGANELLEILKSISEYNVSGADWFKNMVILFTELLAAHVFGGSKVKHFNVEVLTGKSQLETALKKATAVYATPVSDALKERMLDLVLNWNNIDSIEDGIAAAKFLILYLEDPQYLSKISNNQVILKLIRIVHKGEEEFSKICKFVDSEVTSFDEFLGDDEARKNYKELEDQKSKALAEYKLVLNALLRRCFETEEVVMKLIDNIINELMSKNFKSDKFFGSNVPRSINLHEIIKANVATIVRNPEYFAKKISSEILLSRPEKPLSSLNVLKKVEEDNKDSGNDEPNDLPMMDVSTGEVLESGNNEIVKKSFTGKSSGIVDFLLSELMSVKHSEWIGDTPEQKKLYDKINPHHKKSERQTLKTIYNNPKHNYISYILLVLTELLFSYKQSKLEFLTFSKKSILQSSATVKPRSTALNFFLHQLIPTDCFSKSLYNEDSRKEVVFNLSMRTIFALLSSVETDVPKDLDISSKAPPKEDPDMIFIRKFSTDIISKALKDSYESGDVAKNRFGKINNLTNLCTSILGYGENIPCSPFKPAKNDDFFICKAMIERSIPSQMASILTNIDMNFPYIPIISDSMISFLNAVGSLKLNYQDLFKHYSDGEEEEQVQEDEYDSHDEITQLFRNSSLGMYDVEDYNSEDDSDVYDSDDSDDSGLVVYSDEEDALMEHGEGFDDDDNDEDDDSVIEIDVSIDDHDHGTEDEEIEDDEIDVISGRDGSEISFEEGDDEDDDLGDEEISDEGSYISDEDIQEEYYSSSDDSAIIDEWVDNYEESQRTGYPRGGLVVANSGLNGRPDGFGSRMADIFNLRNIPMRTSNNDNDNRLVFHPGNIRDELFNGGDEDDEDEDEDVEDDEDEDEDEDAFVDNAIIEEYDGFNGNFLSEYRGATRLLVNRLNHHRVNPFFDISEAVEIPALLGNGRRIRIHNASNPFLVNPMGSGINIFGNTKAELRSTTQTWGFVYEMFMNKTVYLVALPTLRTIIDLVYDASVEANELKKKLEEAKKKKEMELKEKKRLEEEERTRKERESNPSRSEGQHEREAQASNSNLEPVMVQINEDREVNIAGTDIDPEFLLALPLEMREEVYQQHLMQQQPTLARNILSDSRIDQQFLSVLPDAVRQDIINRTNDAPVDFNFLIDGRRDSSNSNHDNDESDNANNTNSNDENEGEESVTKTKKYFTPLVEKSGVSGILKQIFIERTITDESEIRSFANLLSYLCDNKHTRSETISLLLYILQEGINDYKSLEKVYNRLSSRSTWLSQNKQGTASTPVQTNPVKLPLKTSIVSVAAFILNSLNTLLDSHPHLRYYFLTEHESAIQIRKPSKPKSKLNEVLSAKEAKYPINILLSLMENSIVKKEKSLMLLLSRTIRTASTSLPNIEKAKIEDNSDDADGSGSKKLDLPIVPVSLLSSMVSVMIAGDTNTKTFQQALTTLKNFSSLPNSKQVFSTELSNYATICGKQLVSDLKQLSEAIDKANDPTDIDGDVFDRFINTSSSQYKLLRVLTALDYLFDYEKDGDSLKALYEKIALGSLWGNLSNCLRGLETKKNLHSVATSLLPLIESLMVVCKHSKVKDLQAKDTLKYELKAPDLANEPIESLFFSFTNEHKVILNEMIRSMPKLISGPFAMLVRNPKMLEFDNKRNYFDSKLHNKTTMTRNMVIRVSRDQVFLDSYRACAFKSADEFRNGKLSVVFKDEGGVDAGGLTREWYQVLSRQIFNPDYALFLPVPSDESTFHPNRTSWVNSEHLYFFKFVGRIIGKAIYDGQLLDAHFSRAVYKSILGKSVSLKDMETLDLDYANSLKWILKNDITGIIEETFCLETEDYGEHKIVDLIPDGRDIPVTEENKQEYVQKVAEYRLLTSVKEQTDSFLQGFFDIIPKELISIFDEQELELLISGLPDIDVDDWKNNTNYNNYSASNQVIQWFWRAVKSFDNEQKAKLLQFVTGTSKVPLAGFAGLAGVHGSQKFSIHRDYGSLDRLPSAHTCFNQLDLPAYESYEQLRGSLLLAITEGHEGFGFA